MSYRVKMTECAIAQTAEITAYIADVLLSPDTARRFTEKLRTEIAKLAFMPARVPLTDEEPWRSAGIHRLTVKNFLVYFYIDEARGAVWVTGVLYNRRDRIASLVNMPLSDGVSPE